jgi:hypothetical protein
MERAYDTLAFCLGQLPGFEDYWTVLRVSVEAANFHQRGIARCRLDYPFCWSLRKDYLVGWWIRGRVELPLTPYLAVLVTAIWAGMATQPFRDCQIKS